MDFEIKSAKWKSVITQMLLIVAVSLACWGCAGSSGNDDDDDLDSQEDAMMEDTATGDSTMEGSTTEDSTNTADTATGCSGTANYTVVFQSTWSSTTHPTDFPTGAHFSGLIGATHNADVTFWASGATASDGIELMAETGGKSLLSSEVATAITAQTAGSELSGGGISSSPGSVTLDFEMTSEFSRVSLVSMIAPSPDWFVGVSGLEFCENNEWLSSKTVELFAYDAGTDSGTEYTSVNSNTSPREAIARLTTGVFEVNGTVPSLGTFTFTRN